jgi:tRNA(Ile2) C34 agmatinyltransferase TiaS
METREQHSPLCPVCNKRATKLVAMEDTGKGERVCIDCKRKIQKGLPIEKFVRIK